jgi:hypothetical protein
MQFAPVMQQPAINNMRLAGSHFSDDDGSHFSDDGAASAAANSVTMAQLLQRRRRSYFSDSRAFRQ